MRPWADPAHDEEQAGKTVWLDLAPGDDGLGWAGIEFDLEDLVDPVTIEGHQPGFVDTTGTRSVANDSSDTANVVVQLLDLPVLLYGAWRQLAEEVLRDQFLANLDREAAESAVHTHAEAAGALAILENTIPVPPPPQTAEQSLASASGGAATLDVDLVLSAEARQQFATLDATLQEAVERAAELALLRSPLQPELRQLRLWLCDQVRTQADGSQPVSWLDQEPRAVPARPAPVAYPKGWKPDEVEAATTPTVAADSAGTIVAASPSLVRLLGYRSGELVGQRLVELVPPRFRDAHIAGFTRYQLRGHGPLIDHPVVVPVLTAEGAEVVRELMVSVERAGSDATVFVAQLRPRPTVA